MTRRRVYLRSKLSKFLPNVLAEPARFYFWRFLRRLEPVSCPINNMAFAPAAARRRQPKRSVVYCPRRGRAKNSARPGSHLLIQITPPPLLALPWVRQPHLVI